MNSRTEFGVDIHLGVGAGAVADTIDIEFFNAGTEQA